MTNYFVTMETPCLACKGSGRMREWLPSIHSRLNPGDVTDCTSCRGTGKTREEIPLIDALQDLGFLDDPELGPPMETCVRCGRTIYAGEYNETVDVLGICEDCFCRDEEDDGDPFGDAEDDKPFA